MTRVMAKLPECSYLQFLQERPEIMELWKKWVGHPILINEVIEPLSGCLCDTDKAFEIVEPMFLQEYFQDRLGYISVVT